MSIISLSTEKLKRQLEGLESGLSVPGLPADERDMHNTLAAAIRAELARRAQQPAAPPPPAPQPTHRVPPFPSGEGSGVGFTSAEGQGTEFNTARGQVDTPAAPRPHTRPTAPAPPATLHIIAPLPGQAKLITIAWGDGDSETLTEGEARSRFTSRLRDLASSTYARQERYDHIVHYLGFHRAVGYYRALCALWERAPSAQELDIDIRARVRATIFARITAAATT